ncbi:uncharacterized protein Z518_02739 [Rhinocladiella mackenziei CBS 650.93]|uniref:Ankyrin n=1 Tax=Rhinocladiella mackenziei CBS 650.93 TaxID=1442369 RepID=A0A0D2IQA9_9EURO|nr:uncharacterized protein Z518_02739 [Rhinocladiella mackenziei CBS 650.93]KIX08084.1 hypothetical protein Z518_02739 [Rhinocladiella mackenziei CBS 650.93]
MGRPVLHVAAAYLRHGQEEVVDLLFKHGARPGHRGFQGGSALHAAIFREKSQPLPTKVLVEKLIQHGVPLDTRDNYGRTALHLAVQTKNLEAVELLLQVGASPKYNVFHWTAGDGKDMTKYILNTSDLNSKDDTRRTPLHLAILSGCLNTVQQLLSAGANTELTDEQNQTPLHYAAEHADLDILEALIAARANLDAVDKWRNSPLHLAAQKGNSAVAQKLVAAGVRFQVNGEQKTALHLAAQEGHDETVHTLLHSGIGDQEVFQQDDEGRTALHFASERGRSSVTTQILDFVEQSAAIDIQDHLSVTALHLASKRGHLHIVQSLIQAGSFVYRTNRNRDMAVHFAAESGYLEIVEELLAAIPAQVERCLKEWDRCLPQWPSEEDGVNRAFLEVLVNINARQALKSKIVTGLQTWDKERYSIPSTALMRAVRGGHVDIVKFLLKEVPGMPLDTPTYHEPNVLSLAASKGRRDVATLLIAAGSEVNAIADSQVTCLHEAAENRHADVVDLLLEEGANPDLASLRDGYTPLHLAAEKGHTETVKSLIRLAFFNVIDDLGRTPLHLAAEKGHTEIVKTLLGLAFVNEIDDLGRTPLRLACQGGKEEVVELLLNADAHVLILDFTQKTPLMVASERGYERILARLQVQAKRQRQAAPK